NVPAVTVEIPDAGIRIDVWIPRPGIPVSVIHDGRIASSLRVRLGLTRVENWIPIGARGRAHECGQGGHERERHRSRPAAVRGLANGGHRKGRLGVPTGRTAAGAADSERRFSYDHHYASRPEKLHGARVGPTSARFIPARLTPPGRSRLLGA